MSKKDSVQTQLGKVRPPRVHLTYDVQVGDAIEKREIPFVIGVLGDFSGTGTSERPSPKLKERKFVSIDLASFDDVMSGLSPKITCRVRNALTEEGGEFGVELEFKSMDDFKPESVVQQIEPLRNLLEARGRLSDLRNKLAGNDKLDDLLSEVLTNTEKLERLRAEAKGK